MGSARVAAPRSARQWIDWTATALLALALASAAGREARAETAAPLKLELNRLEAQGENCRATMLIANPAGAAWRSLKVDLFALDTDGVAQKRLAVELGPVAAKKTVIKLFDFAGLACPKFGRILLNDVIACETGEARPEGRDDCLAAIETASRVGAVAFDK